MPRGMYRSRTLRRVFVKTPGAKINLQYKQRKPSKAKCANCGKQLAGVPRELPIKMANLPKTKKRPERIYGGVYCAGCTKAMLQQKVRGEQ